MRWEEFINITSELAVIDTEILLAGVTNTTAIKVQISRWQKSGRLIQLKRGLYLLAESYRKTTVYEPYIASVLKKPSYISMEKALEYHGLIPEAVTIYTSVTPKRQAKFTTKEGTFLYRHIKNTLFWGYESVTVNNQTAFIALPEKALLDLIYLNKIKATNDYLQELRLQNTENIDTNKLFLFAKKFKKPGILKSAEVIQKYIQTYRKEEKTL